MKTLSRLLLGFLFVLSSGCSHEEEIDDPLVNMCGNFAVFVRFYITNADGVDLLDEDNEESIDYRSIKVSILKDGEFVNTNQVFKKDVYGIYKVESLEDQYNMVLTLYSTDYEKGSTTLINWNDERIANDTIIAEYNVGCGITLKSLTLNGALQSTNIFKHVID